MPISTADRVTTHSNCWTRFIIPKHTGELIHNCFPTPCLTSIPLLPSPPLSPSLFSPFSLFTYLQPDKLSQQHPPWQNHVPRQQTWRNWKPKKTNDGNMLINGWSLCVHGFQVDICQQNLNGYHRRQLIRVELWLGTCSLQNDVHCHVDNHFIQAVYPMPQGMLLEILLQKCSFKIDLLQQEMLYLHTLQLSYRSWFVQKQESKRHISYFSFGQAKYSSGIMHLCGGSKAADCPRKALKSLDSSTQQVV